MADTNVSGNVTAACTWDMVSSVPCRVGPDPLDGKKNQTAFIRGFKIAIRKGIFDRILGDVIVSPSSIFMHGIEGIECGGAGQASEGNCGIVGEHEQNSWDTPHHPEPSDPGIQGLDDLSLDHVPFISKVGAFYQVTY